MKRFDHLYDELTSFENLWLAERKAARGKRGQGAVAAFEFDLEANLWQLHEELAGQTYRPGPYTSFTIRDPKHRLISAAPYRDRAMSIFTYHLIEALTGHASPAAGASEVLVSDVMSHVWRRVPASARADWDAEQQPDFLVSGNFPVALLLGGKGVGKGVTPPDPLAPLTASPLPPGTTIHTGGGAYIGGNVTIGGGKFVGRDEITIIGDGNVVGDHSRATVGKRG